MDTRSISKISKTTETSISATQVRAQFSNYVPIKGTWNYLPSETIPDMSMTIPQLLLNHSRGMAIPINKGEQLFFGEEIPQFDDVTERDEYRANLLQQIKDIEDEIKQTELSVPQQEIEITKEIISS